MQELSAGTNEPLEELWSTFSPGVICPPPQKSQKDQELWGGPKHF